MQREVLTMSPFKCLYKKFNIFHAIGFSVGTHLLFLTFFPGLPEKATIKLENKVEKVRLEIIKKTKPVHKKNPIPIVNRVEKRVVKKPIPVVKKVVKKTMPVMRTAVFRTAVQALPKQVPIKPLRSNFTQSVNLNPARKIYVSRNTSLSVSRVNVAYAPISSSRINEVSSVPYSKRAVSGRGHSNLRHDFKVARRVSSFTPSNDEQAGKAVRVSTRSFSSPSFAPTARVVKSIMKGANEESNSITGDDFKEVWGLYTHSIQLKIAQAKIYPSLARERKQQGKAFLSFKLDRNGKILELSVENSSGYKILDQAAIRAIKEAAPFPTIPESLNKNYASLKIPISFILR
jgi:TonB family protein